MARAQAQYLKLFNGSTTYQRWQSYYVGQTVTWSSGSWLYQQFDCDGFTAGQGSSEASLSVTLPATQFVVDQVERALREAWLAELSLYEFDPLLGNATPQAAQALVAAYTGEVVSASGSLTTITISLGSSLSPVGAQVPPRQFTTRLIGVPCQL
jgi:hypothetical protein